jgi:hypothetical protein
MHPGVPTVKASEVAAAPRRTLGGGSGLRLKKANEAASTDMEAMRAARMRKYEAFHGTGKSLSGKVSSVSAGVALGSSSRSLGGGNTTGGGATEEEEKSQVPVVDAEEKKPSFSAFQGSGRRLR